MDATQTGGYLEEYPAPVVIATALSTNPSAWLTAVVKRAGSSQSPKVTQSFVHRMGKERPRFATTEDLGHGVVKLLAKAGPSSAAAFRPLAANEQVDDARSDANLRLIFGLSFASERRSSNRKPVATHA